MDNTLEIAERCQIELKLGQLLLPEFPLPREFKSPEDYIASLARDGAMERYGKIDEKIEARLQHELGVIDRMGFAGYFLITSDFVRAAKERDIPVGPGRGSAAGSIVCYAIGNHRRRSSRARPAVRTVPESRSNQHAGHRHRFLFRAA